MSSIKEQEEVNEPDLVYFKPDQKPAFVTPEPMMTSTYAIRNPPQHCGQPFPPRFHPFLQSQAFLMQPQPQMSGICYPLTSVSQSYIQEQQRGAGDHLHLYPGTDGFQGVMTTDSLIQEEVTRAAKTLFSKRNRTLLHWLNPGVSKGQLKIDVNAAWDSLPQAEKLFYISQVLGKFAPHTTSLMVNPQLEPNSQPVCTDICKPMEGLNRKTKKQNQKRQPSTNGKRKVILLSDDDISCDSGLVVDMDAPKTKRKYTRRKPKEIMEKLSNDTEINITTDPLDEMYDEQIKPSDEQKPTDSTNQTESIVIQSKKEVKCKKSTKQSVELATPRVKRKYVKRKLVRKKYTRRKPKENLSDNIAPKIEEVDVKGSECFINCEKSSDSFTAQTDSGGDIDIWIDLETDVGFEDFNLLNEEVDNFWDSIEDPSSLFTELDIE